MTADRALAAGLGLSLTDGGANSSLTVGFAYTATPGTDPAMAANGTIFGSNGTVFEGATADTTEGILSPAALTADRTWALPDATGTVSLGGITNGTTTDATLRWNGTTWAENSSVRATSGGVLQVGGSAAAAYSRIGTAATTHALAAASDLVVNGSAEVDGTFYADGNVTLGDVSTDTISFVGRGTPLTIYSDDARIILDETPAGGTIYSMACANNRVEFWDVTGWQDRFLHIVADSTDNGAGAADYGAIYFNNSANSGFRCDATGVMQYQNNGGGWLNVQAGGAVLLGPATAQDWSVNNPGIFINENAAGSPNLIQLRSGGAERLLIDNSGNLVFEGSSNDASETTLSITNPTSDRTITFPDAGGTVAVSASGNIALSAAGNITFTGTLPVGSGGTGTSTTFTQGSVVFAGASGVYAQDNANFFWDDSNNRLGLWTTGPQTTLQVQSRTDDWCSVRVGSDSANDAGIIFFTSNADWTIGVDNSDSGKFKWGLNNWVPGNSTQMTLTTAGRLGIGTTAPSYALEAAGDIYANGGWMRVSGNQGLYFESWGGGWYMTDGTWVRCYNGKSVYASTSAAASIYGLQSTNTDSNTAIYGDANNASLAWAGFFEGDVHMRDLYYSSAYASYKGAFLEDRDDLALLDSFRPMAELDSATGKPRLVLDPVSVPADFKYQGPREEMKDSLSTDRLVGLALGAVRQLNRESKERDAVLASRVERVEKSVLPTATEARGEGALFEGQAWIDLPSRFADALSGSEAPHVILTLLDDCRGLFVARRTPRGFQVSEVQGGHSSARFLWEARACPPAGVDPSPPDRSVATGFRDINERLGATSTREIVKENQRLLGAGRTDGFRSFSDPVPGADLGDSNHAGE
ncbi:MAG: shufflon system plasmid conjugative transfer pilus tip adhesin PilV [Planctomycetes bacterium]|nr:shufflon system plasmid conjugative transfer pilus tip adhesin PilV [Planctomycetota bacterium]